MAVMTHAQNQAHTADYNKLTRTLQDSFDALMEDADAAATLDSYRTAMARAAATAGIPLPASWHIARCSCRTDAGGCGCGLIFDAAQTGVIVTANADPGFNLAAHQCPTCGHDHPRPAGD